MAIRTFDVVLGAAATQISTTHVACQEMHFTNPNTGAGHTVDVGLSNVGTVPGIRIPIGATDAPGYRILGNGPSGTGPFNISDVWLKGTQNDHVYVLAITL